MLGEPEAPLSLTRAPLSTDGRTKSKFLLSVLRVRIVVLFLPLLPFPCSSFAEIVLASFTTTNANLWRADATGVTNAVPLLQSPLSGTPGITPVAVTLFGGPITYLNTNQIFDGFWVAYYRFFLPATAAYTRLVYSNYMADDRTVMLLNDNVVSSFGMAPSGSPTNQMVLTNGGALLPYSFSEVLSSPAPWSRTVTSGFILGKTNVLKFIMNNTGHGVYGPLKTVSITDITFLKMDGYVAYEVFPSIRVTVWPTNVVSVSCGGTIPSFYFYLQASDDLSAWQDIALVRSRSSVMLPATNRAYFRLRTVN